MNDTAPLHVLVCVARPDEEPRVLAHAAGFAAAAGARISMLHVVESDTTDEARSSLRQKLTDLAGAAGVSADLVVAGRHDGEDEADAIVRVGAEIAVDLFALDSRDLSMLRHVLRGSTAMEVISQTDRPVMLASGHVRPPRRGGAYHITVTSDGSPSSDGIFSRVTRIMETPGLRFTLLQLHVPRLGDRGRLLEMDTCERRLDAVRPALPPSADVDCRVGAVEGLESVPHAIIRIAGELGADAIAMATRGESAARHILVGSVALAVAEHSPLPVILARG